MKTVYSNDELPHIWAHQSQNHGRNSNDTFYFQQSTIYSYGNHFPIAKIYPTENVTLITSQEYSVTTQRHISRTHQAINGNYISVYNVRANSKREHKENYQRLITEHDDLIKKSIRARSNKEWHIKNAKCKLDTANEYSKLFKLGYAEKTFSFNESEIKAIVLKQAQKDKLAKEKRTRKLLVEQKDNIRNWRNCENVHTFGLHNLPVMLRVKDNQVETSHGAKFPIDHATFAWKVISKCIDKGEAWHSNGHTVKLGHYQVNSVSKTGTLVAGCHTVPYSESLAIAEQLNLI